jgi:hypothetical protein
VPSWSPNWTDVRFDHQAAQAAADACERAASVVRDTTGHGQLLAAGARREGAGAWRLPFDETLATLAARAEEAESRLRQVAQQLRESSRSAHAEQAARLESRHRWMLEAAAEPPAIGPSPPR